MSSTRVKGLCLKKGLLPVQGTKEHPSRMIDFELGSYGGYGGMLNVPPYPNPFAKEQAVSDLTRISV